MQRSGIPGAGTAWSGGRIAMVGAVVLAALLVTVWWWPEADAKAPPLETRGETASVPGDQETPAAEGGAGGAAGEAPAATRTGGGERARSRQEEAEEQVAKAEAFGDPDRLRRLVGLLVLDDALPREFRKSLRERADALNKRLVFSQTPAAGFRRIRVEPGDSYWKICRRLVKEDGISVGSGMLELINGIPARRLRAGIMLKVPEEPVGIVVDKSDFEVTLTLGGIYLKRWPVGIGRDDLTPEGSFTIRGKTRKPTWTDPRTGRVLEYGEEGHVIGSRWLGFERDGVPTGFGIHGTNAPGTIGAAASDGCIRMRNADVEQLFDLVPEGTPVTVRP